MPKFKPKRNGKTKPGDNKKQRPATVKIVKNKNNGR